MNAENDGGYSGTGIILLEPRLSSATGTLFARTAMWAGSHLNRRRTP